MYVLFAQTVSRRLLGIIFESTLGQRLLEEVRMPGVAKHSGLVAYRSLVFGGVSFFLKRKMTSHSRFHLCQDHIDLDILTRAHLVPRSHFAISHPVRACDCTEDRQNAVMAKSGSW